MWILWSYCSFWNRFFVEHSFSIYFAENNKGKRKLYNLSHGKDNYCKECVYRSIRTIVFWSSLRLISFPSSQCLDTTSFLLGKQSLAETLLWGGWAGIIAAITAKHGTKRTQICPWTQPLWGCAKRRTYTSLPQALRSPPPSRVFLIQQSDQSGSENLSQF